MSTSSTNSPAPRVVLDIPGDEAGCLNWLRNFSAQVAQDGPRFDVAPDAAARLAERIDAFDEAYHAAFSPGTRTLVGFLKRIP